jgi:hypothetical protein
MKVKDKTKTTAAKIKFKKTVKYTWMDYEGNKDISKELKAIYAGQNSEI